MRVPLILVFLFAAASAHAQPLIYHVNYRPAGASFLVLASPHFDIIYEQGYEAEAVELAEMLERHLPPVAELVGHRGYLRMPVVLRGYNDNANGFVTVRPFKQEIDATSIKGPEITSRYGTWIEAVAPHELVHALHADARPGGGIGTLIRPFAPDHARSINLGGPPGVNEGIAVWYESSFRANAGRLNHPHFTMKFRAAMAGGHWSLARMLERTSYTRPFDRHYIGGAYYADYLAERDEFESFRRSRRMFYRLPFLGYGVSMWWGNGEAPYRTGAALRQMWWEAERERVLNDGPFDSPNPLISEAGTVVLSPRWLDSESVVVHARGYALRPGFYRVDARDGSRMLIRNENLTDEGTFHLDQPSGTITFSRYVADVLPTGAAKAGAFQVQVEEQRKRTIAPRARVHAPVMLQDGSVLAIRNEGQQAALIRIEADGSHTELTSSRASYRQLAPRPGTSEVAVLVNFDGQEGVLLGNPSSLEETLQPWLFLEGFPMYDLEWSADGQILIFSGAPGDVSNIFAFDVESGSVYQLTNARFGALHGALSPDGAALAYVHYQHERHELVVEPVRYDAEIEVSRVEPQWQSGRETRPATTDAQPYRPSRYLAPRLLSPVVIVDDDVVNQDDVSLGPGFGISVEGVDPLNRWAYGGQAYYRKRTIWGSAGISYGGFAFTPTFRIFREPSTVLAQFGDGTTQRIGRERQGFGISGSLPLTLHANVFTTRVGIGLGANYERERLFDDDGNAYVLSGQQSDYRDVATLRPNAFLMYRVQSNTRDLAPNNGIIFTTSSRFDVWDELDRPARSLLSRLYAYLPILSPINGSVRLDAGVLVQNARGGMETSLFLPRGFRSRFLGEGTFARAGLEVTQPIAFVDDGSVLVPFYLKAIYGYAAAEGLRTIDGPAHELASITVGLGVQARLFHLTDIDIRWGITIRDDAGIQQSWR